MNPVAWLGDIGDINPAAWEKYILGQNGSLQAAWDRALTARNQLKKVREDLGLPFIVNTAGEGSVNGAWNDDFEKNMLELKAMVTFLDQVTNEAVAGKRALVFNNQTKDFGLQLLPTDTLRIAQTQQGRPVLVNVETGQPITEFSGTVGAVPPVVIIGVVVVAAVAIWAVAEEVCDTVKTAAREKTTQTIRETGVKLIEEGKATPEQVATMDKALLDGTANVIRAGGEASEQSSQIPKTIRTVAWVALGVAGLWVAGNLIASRGAGTPALARNPSGPLDVKLRLERVPLNQGGYDARGRYWGAEFVNGRRVTNPLYKYESDTGQIHGYVRASSREDAKRQVRLRVSQATFYRAAA
jgi:hypothetical protein